MANLIVSNVCNMACPYCFAGQHMQTAQTNSTSVFISLDAFDRRLDFLDRSGINEVRLIGGEPTLHPQFPDLIRRARLRNKPVMVFSHGVIAERALACLEALPPEACTVLINMNARRRPGGPSARESARRRTVVQRLGTRAFPGFTIFTPGFDLDWLLALILETGCRKAIRLGVAQPMAQTQNVSLHPKQYPVVGHKISLFASAAAEAGIRLEFDCGFVRCMFSDADLETLKQAQAHVGWHCNPILDIDLEEQAVYCFPLTGQAQMSVTGDAIASDLRGALAARMQPYRSAGIYKECSTCRFKANGLCTGGCLAATLRRFRQADIRFAVPNTVLANEQAE